MWLKTTRIPCRTVLLCAALTLEAGLLNAQTPRDFAIDLSAAASTNSPCLTLNWSIRRSGNIKYQRIHRRLKGETSWVKLSDLDNAQTSYADSNAVTGVEYEYWMERYYTNISPSTAMGYLSAGVNVPMVESRGKLLLVVDSTMVAPLAPEIEQLKADLTGEGWSVQTLTATRTDTAANVKAQILSAYNADPDNVKMVYLLGHVPVPYSGYMAPDGHGDHSGAWPADGYYGEMNGTWTDSSVNTTSASRNQNDNVPGDGKFDQNSFPNFVELMVGRVDLHTMTRAPSSGASETTLLRRYLRRAHDFRMKQGAYANIPRRSLIRDGFGQFGSEAFSICGWAWAFTCVGQAPGAPIDEPASGAWFSGSYAGGRDYLMAYGNGGGSYESAASVGHTADFGLKPSRAVFTSLFGSYFGDWDADNNFMRAVLAGNATGDSLGLTCFWGGRPNRFMHPLAMGAPAAYGMWISQNGSLTGGGGYTPNSYAGTHTGLMGDPALRMYAVEPPRNLTAVSANGHIALAWADSTETNLLGYHVFRATTAAGPFTRLTAEPLATPAFTDTTVSAGTSYSYMVRTLKREYTPGGTFDNLSVGAPVTLTANADAAAVPGAPGQLTVKQFSSTNATLTWVDASASETGFRIERKTNAAGTYAPIGTVAADVETFTDTGVFTHGNVYYYRVVATGAAGDSLPSAFASFDAVAGFFDLPATRIKASKTSGTAAVTVNRFGGVTGSVSVNFATSDTSAFAGTHYMPTNGTLTWADGDTAPKTISVPLINTAAPQAARQFKVTLSSPSSGTTLTINTYAAVLIQDPTATLSAPWSQSLVGGITDSSAAVTEAGNISSVTIGGAGLNGSATSESGQFVYQSFTGNGVLTAFLPAGIPGDGNARHALMARASPTANNATMAAAVSSSTTSFGTKLYSRAVTGASSVETPSAANALTFPRWVRLSRSSNVFGAETSLNGTEWTAVSTAFFTNMPPTAYWGFFHTSSDWSVTGLGNYHLAQLQNVSLTALPPPTMPIGLTASLSTTTSAALRWNIASFASGYRIERRTESGGFETIAAIAAGTGTNLTYSNTGLAFNTAYAYRVVATNAVGESAPSAPAYVATSSDRLVVLTPDSDATVQLNLADTPLGTQTNLSVAAYDPMTDGLATNTAKSYLRFNLAGLGTVSSATLKLSLLGLREYEAFGYTYMYIGALSESADTWSEGTITWSNAPQNNLEGEDFLTPVSTLGSFYSFANDSTLPGTVLPFTLSASTLNSSRGANQLVTLGLYQYYGAYVDWASREHSTFQAPTLELIVVTNVPPRASFLTATPGTGWSIDLRWQDNSTNETGFVLERREGAGAFAALQTFGANTTAYTDTATQPGVTYTYRLHSFNANGPADWTPEVTLTAATVETAISTVWDGGGADALFTTATNWDFNTVPPTNGTWTLAFGTGGATATLNSNADLRGLLLNRDAAFTLAAGGGTLTLREGGLRALLPTANARTYTLAPDIVLASNQTWAVTNNGAGVATVAVAGRLSDGGAGRSLTKSGNGVLILSGDNSYGGVTTVRTGGVLRISHANALGSTNGFTSIENGGWLELSGGITVREPITLAGDAALGYAGTVRSTSGNNIWSGPITFNGARVRVSAGNLDIVGGCSGSGGVFGTSAGTVLRISNLPINFGAGTLSAHLSSGIFSLNVAGNAWGTMDLSGGTVRTDVPDAFPATSTLQLQTGSTVDLNGNSQTVGQLKNANATVGTRLITSATPATLTVNQSATSYFDGVLSGALALTKAGNGTLTLSNALHTLSGPITVQGGTLTVAPATRLGPSTNITVTSGTLALNAANALTNTATLSIANGGAKVSLAAGVTQTVERLYLGGQRKGRSTWGASGSGAEYVDDAHFAGSGVVFVSSGVSTVWDGGGAQAAASAPENWDYDVRPAFDGSATLSFGSGGDEAAIDLPVALSGLRLERDADFQITAAGGLLSLGAGGLWAQSPSATSRTYTVSAQLLLAADQSWGVTNNGAGVTALHVSGPIGDGASVFGLTKSGNGVLTLSGDNSYDGATSVASGGVLRVAHSHALGSTNGPTSVALGAWLEIGGGAAVPEPLTLAADATPDSGGALRATDGTNVWLGRITQTGVSRIRASGASRLTLAGGVSGTFNLYLSPDAGAELVVADAPVNLGSTSSSRILYASGAGTVALAVPGHTFGALTVAGLTLRTDVANAWPAATILALGASSSPDGTVDLNGNSQTVGQLKRGITTSGARLVTSAAPATLTVNGSTSTTYDGQFGGALGLTKAGTAALNLLGGGNTCSGTTTLAGGTLDLYAGADLGHSARIVLTSGTLRLRGTGALDDGAAILISTGAKMRVDSGVETVGTLAFDGKLQRRGTYGASTSGAQYTNNLFFSTSGTGILHVQRGTESVITIR